jgi:uncharacterized membrane protein
MKAIADFFKTTLTGGFFVLLPMLLFYLLLDEMLTVVVALATPIADLFPRTTFERINFPVLVALLLIIGASFLLGLAMRADIGARLVHWLERNTVGRVPLYAALKGLTTRLAEMDEGQVFKPALLVSGNGEREFAYLIEDHGDGQCTVMLPWSPTPLAGSVKLVRRDDVELLNASLGDVTRVLSHWGVGAAALLGKSKD